MAIIAPLARPAQALAIEAAPPETLSLVEAGAAMLRIREQHDIIDIGADYQRARKACASSLPARPGPAVLRVPRWCRASYWVGIAAEVFGWPAGDARSLIDAGFRFAQPDIDSALRAALGDPPTGTKIKKHRDYTIYEDRRLER
jgi:hypothetical protein